MPIYLGGLDEHKDPLKSTEIYRLGKFEIGPELIRASYGACITKVDDNKYVVTGGFTRYYYNEKYGSARVSEVATNKIYLLSWLYVHSINNGILGRQSWVFRKIIVYRQLAACSQLG